VSAYSLLNVTHRVLPLLEKNGGSIVSLTYLAAERAVPSYNVMGSAKAVLEQATRQMAYELGPKNIRVNAVSAGPVSTLAARGIKGFVGMHKDHAERAALKRNITQEEVGKAALFLLSDLSSGVTGEVLYVDAGYRIMGGGGAAGPVTSSRPSCRLAPAGEPTRMPRGSRHRNSPCRHPGPEPPEVRPSRARSSGASTISRQSLHGRMRRTRLAPAEAQPQDQGGMTSTGGCCRSESFRLMPPAFSARPRSFAAFASRSSPPPLPFAASLHETRAVLCSARVLGWAGHRRPPEKQQVSSTVPRLRGRNSLPCRNWKIATGFAAPARFTRVCALTHAVSPTRRALTTFAMWREPGRCRASALAWPAHAPKRYGSSLLISASYARS
jgi:hypothetical protein